MKWFSNEINHKNWFDKSLESSNWFSEFLDSSEEVVSPPTSDLGLTFQFYRGFLPTDTSVALYRNPSTLNLLNTLVVTNADITNEINFYIVPDGEVVAEEYKILSKKLTELKTYDLSFFKGLVLNQGDMLYMACTNADSASVVITGASGHLLGL